MAISRPARMRRGPSPSTEHYLRAILELREERGYARVVDIATRLGLTKGSVSVALGLLEARRLVRFDAARFPQLTASGLRVAIDVRGRYDIVRRFLTDVLGVAPERAAAEACRWEHVISHEVADRMLDLLRFRSESTALAQGLADFADFRRSCHAGEPCAACAVHGPVESFCGEGKLVAFPARPADKPE